MPWAVHPSAVARATTSELFPALDRSARVVTLQQLFDAAPGEAMPLALGLQLGAALAERVATIHAAGRSVGALDAARVRISVDGRVSLARTGETKLAPEAAVSPASDVYATAYLIHQMLTGTAPLPTVAVPPSRFNPQLDAEVDAVMLAALRETPEERPASVLALQGALEGLGEELGLKLDPRALGRIVEHLVEGPPPAIAPPAPAPQPVRPTLADKWLANPGPIVRLDEDEDDEDTATQPRYEPTRPAPWMFAFGAALVAMLSTAVLMARGSGSHDETQPVRAAVVAPPSPKVSRPTLVAVAPQTQAPAKPAHPAKRRIHRHRR